MTTPTLLVIWHSRTGAARRLAQAACSGARAAMREDADGGVDRVDDAPQTSCRPAPLVAPCDASPASPGQSAMRHDASQRPRVRIECVHASRVDAQRVCAASAYLFVAPENLAALSGVMKEFFDRTYYAVLERIAGRPYGIIVAAGSDGHGAVRQIERIVTGWRLRSVAEPLVVVTGAQSPAAIAAPKRLPPGAAAKARELGAALATGIALGIF